MSSSGIYNGGPLGGGANPALAYGMQPAGMPPIPTLAPTPTLPGVTMPPIGLPAAPTLPAISLPGQDLLSQLFGVTPQAPVNVPSPYSPEVMQQQQAYAAAAAARGGYASTILSGNANATTPTGDTNPGAAANTAPPGWWRPYGPNAPAMGPPNWTPSPFSGRLLGAG